MTTEPNDADIAKRAELNKRYAAAHKASLAKVSSHLAMCKSAHAKGMACMAKGAKMMVEADHAKKAADMSSVAGAMSAAHDHFNTAADHMDDMEAHLGKAMSAFGHNTAVNEGITTGGEITLPALSDLTEGEVPWYDAAEPYGAAATVKGAVTKLVASGALLTKAQVEKMVTEATEKAAKDAKAASTVDSLTEQVKTLQKSIEVLSRQPAGQPRVKIFDVVKSPMPGMPGSEGADNATKTAAILEGVDMNIQNENDFTKAGGLMIANMIKNGPKFGGQLFGKPPMWDPSFHGRGGTGSRN